MVAVSGVLIGAILGAATDAEAQRRRRRRRGPGTLVVETSVENAEVLVDEETVGFTPLDPVEVSPGSHTVRVRRPGFTEFVDVVEVAPGTEVRLPVSLMALAMVLTVRSEPDLARVFVDGTFRGETPLELELIDGEHSVRVTAAGYREVIRTVQATPGSVDALDVELEPIPEELLEPDPPAWYEEPVTWVVVGGAAAAVAVAIVVTAVLLQPEDALADYCGEDRSGCYTVMPTEWQF